MAHIEIEKIRVYQRAMKVSNDSWKIYEKLNWQVKKVIGDQFMAAIDSIGANIAEGYGRFHYLDRIKFYYNARGSLLEAIHWLELLNNRQLINSNEYKNLKKELLELKLLLNAFIKSNYKNRNSEEQ